ncbi:MAG: hypothetical protein HC815_05715 [Richelia sp. RM1_1_1]|nr:hypothetical protein [Richelia sp. RM1_1_1]
MARRKSISTVIEAAVTFIPYNMGEFEVTPYIEQQYTSVYYGVREIYGQVCKKSDPQFDWEAFNAKFEGCFGKVEDEKNSLEELGKFAQIYFNKSIEEVIDYNRNSLNRRKKSTSTTEMPKLKTIDKVEVVEKELPY